MMRSFLLILSCTLWISFASTVYGQGAVVPKVVAWEAAVEPATARPGEKVDLVIRAKIETGWHLYSIKKVEDGPFPTNVTVEENKALAKIGELAEAKSKEKFDENFELNVNYFEKTAEFRVPVLLSSSAKGEIKIPINVRYQVCKDTTCLPPAPAALTATVTISGEPVTQAGALTANFPPTEIASAGATKGEPGFESTVDKAKKEGLIAYLALAVGAGFLALLTPCVFPMIPITVSFFSKKKEGETGKDALKKALAYCAGIVGTFTALGVGVSIIFGASGLTTLANNPWLNLILALLFIALAFSLFGVFEIGIPSSLANKLSPDGKAGLLGPIFMGLTFSLTSFTCTLPFVGAVLVSAANGDYLYPVMGMLGFSIAFCLPFFFLALFPSYLGRIPRSGPWLASVKAFMGFVELAAAVKFLSTFDLGINGGLGLLTREVYLSIWFAIAIVTALYLFRLVRLPKVDDGDKVGPLRAAFGVGMVAISVVMLQGVNGKSVGELEAFLPPSPYPSLTSATGGKIVADNLSWMTNFEDAQAASKKEGKPIFVDFTGIYCTNCRFMEKNVFPYPSVERALEKYVRVKLYTDRGTPEDNKNRALQEVLTNSVTLPVYVVIGTDGKRKVTEFTRNSDAFADFLTKDVTFVARK